MPSNGFTMSTLALTSSLGRLSVSVIFPSPTSLLPDQVITVPSPSGGPFEAHLGGGIELRPRRPGVPFVEVVDLRKDIRLGRRDRGAPIHLELGGLQGDDNDEDEDDCRKSDEDLLQHRSFPGFWLKVAAATRSQDHRDKAYR